MHDGERDALLRRGVEALEEIARQLGRNNGLKEEALHESRKAAQRSASSEIRLGSKIGR